MSKILVVDDESDFAELICFNLKQRGHAVRTFLNGLDAVNQAQKLPPDLVLMDVMMPGIDGFSLCEILRSNPATNRIPVVMYTALGGSIASLNGFEAGADEFLTKPFRMEELVGCVEKLLYGREPKNA
jgi:DNA-binding response OmpR family regulator